MKGDFTRNSFRPEKHYSSVRMQQGRVQLDADWNEQMDIAAHCAGTESVDVIGQAGAPKHAAAFCIVLPSVIADSIPPEDKERVARLLKGLVPGDFLLTPGRFYAGGMLCEVEDYFSLAQQPDFPGATPINADGSYLVYLDVWQRHLTALDDNGIREEALGGLDTATRAKTIWQVKAAKVDAPKCISAEADWAKIVQFSTGQLTARAKPGEDTDNPCVLPPGSGYRRLENQLYRVEIHQPGMLGTATFKWSRDNGTVVTRLAGPVNGKELKVEDLGRDGVLGFNPGDWVELLDDANELNGVHGVMAQIDVIDRATKKVVFKSKPDFHCSPELNAKMRRWDDPNGPREVRIGADANDGFLELEDGVQVKFADVVDGAKAWYNTGDYWLIPARTDSNSVEWPANSETDTPLAQAPQGIMHTYCCLGWITAEKSNSVITLKDPHDCRDIFPPLTDIEDDEEARKRHNRLLHGWGVVCGLQVHCAGGDRVKIEPGCALMCDGSEALLPKPGCNFGVVAAARQAELLNNDGTGKVALTIATHENRQAVFGVRKITSDGSFLDSILKGTLLMDFFQHCVKPVIEFVQREFFTKDENGSQLVSETVRRRTAAINLAVQFVNKSAGSHVLLSEREHAYLENLHDDLKKFLNKSDSAYCGLFEGLERFPDYPFEKLNARTAFGKAPMTQVRVAPDGRVAYAFGGANDPKVYVFDLAKAELMAEIELKPVPGAGALTVRDVASFAKNKIMVAATSGSDSVLYAYEVPKPGGTYVLIGVPVVVKGKQIVRLGCVSNTNGGHLYGISLGEGLVRITPDAPPGQDFFRCVVQFNATGHWVLGPGAAAGSIYAAAGAAEGAVATKYKKVLLLDPESDSGNPVHTFELPGAVGDDGIGVLFRTGDSNVPSQLYVVVDPAAGKTAKRLFVFDPDGNQIATIALPTDGPVSLCPAADQKFMMVAMAEQSLLGWIDPDVPKKSPFTVEHALPTQMYPTCVTTAAAKEKSFVVVANRGSQTLSVLPAELVSSRPTLTVPDMVKYRAKLIALFGNAGLRLLQQLKDCFCEHLRIKCPECTEDDVLELAAVDIREGLVHHICNSRRREVLTFPKLNYWLSLVPVIPVLSYLVREFCCLVPPDLSKPATAAGARKNLIAVSSMLKLREQLTIDRFTAIKKEALGRMGQLGAVFFGAIRAQAVAPFKPDIAVRARELVDSDEETVKRRLAESGVDVNTVADYSETLAGKPWASLADMQFDFKPGDRVNLLVKDGKVALITTAKAVAPAGERAMSSAAGLAKEIERLNTKLADMQASHASYLAASEKEMIEVKSKLEGVQKLLKSRDTSVPSAVASSPKSRTKTK